MKTIIPILTSLMISINLFAVEGNIKVGYDFYRESTNVMESAKRIFYTRGFVIGAEIIPLSYFENRLKIGAGFEYNFGEKTLNYSETANKKLKPVQMIPVYATLKYTYYRKNDFNLYLLSRLGYAFAKERDDDNKFGYVYNKQLIGNDMNAMYEATTSGLYYGLGLGLDYKYFLAEVLYDGKYLPYIGKVIYSRGERETKSAHDFHHKIGLRLGIQLGTQHFSKQIQGPKCDPEIIEKIVRVEKIVEVPEVIEKIVEIPTKEKKIVRKKKKINTNHKWECRLIPKVKK